MNAAAAAGLLLLVNCAPRAHPGRFHENSLAPAQFQTGPRVWHVRLPTRFRQSLPGLCRLSEEFDLLEIRSAWEWREFSGAAGIEPGSHDFDFRRGSVVGIVSYVGEPLTGTWPVRIEAVGSRGGASWMQARLEADFYHTLCSPGYCTFTYVGTRAPIELVEVAHRVFYLRS